MTHADKLKGRLMLYYGTADNNVHPSNTLQLIQALQRAGKSFEVQVGPDAGHSADQPRPDDGVLHREPRHQEPLRPRGIRPMTESEYMASMQHDDPAVGPAELVAAYERGIDDLKAAVAGMTPEQALARPVPGKWSTIEVVAHVADTELYFSDRIERTLALERPLLMSVDEEPYSRGWAISPSIWRRSWPSSPRSAATSPGSCDRSRPTPGIARPSTVIPAS